MLMPKQVELFQDKVQQFPRPDDDFREVQKQAAAELKDELNAIEKNLLAEGSSPDEVRPVSEAASLADALSTSLGPPLKTFNRLKSADAWAGRPLLGLSKALDRETAKYIDDVGDFAEKNDENAGKKIEGTGLIQIGYFSMLFVLFIFGFFAWVGLKVLGTLNPPVAIGTKVATLPVKLAARALGQVVKGGEAFKNELKKKATWSADEVATLFREKQERAQDEESQSTIRELTK
jgi:hypothetical protein